MKGPLRHLPIVPLLCLAAFLLYLPPGLGRALTIAPDCDEYALCLDDFLRHGTFGIALNGVWHPSRYAPWFSLTCLAPFRWLAGGDVYALNLAALAWALALLTLAYAVARGLGMGPWAALLPPASILLLPDFAFLSRMVMTEVPYTALLLAAALVFMKYSERATPAATLAGGLLAAWCGAVRSTGLALLPPFATLLAWRFRKKGLTAGALALRLALLLLPALLYEFLNARYNLKVFGSPFRTGYHFWLPIIHDYPGVAFSPGNLAANLRFYLGAPPALLSVLIPAGLSVPAAAALRGRSGGLRANRPFLLLFAFLLFHGAVLLALYLGYYFADGRFFLPSLVAWVVPAFAAAAKAGRRWPPVLLFLLAALAFPRMRPQHADMVPSGYAAKVCAEAVSAVLPEKSALVALQRPGILCGVGAGDRDVEVVPLYRSTEYTVQMVADRSVAGFGEPPGETYPLIRYEYVAAGLCRLPFPDVFLEDAPCVTNLMARGRRVFLHYDEAVFSPEYGNAGWVGEKLDGLGLRMEEFACVRTPAIRPNPLRHVYDGYVLRGVGMDEAPAITTVFYELVPK